MKLLKTLLPLLIILLSTIIAYSQTTLKGKIIDAETGESLSDVSILIKDSYSGTLSNLDGSYLLKIDRKLPITIRFSYVGFLSQEIVLNNDSAVISMNIELEPQAVGTNEIIVTAQLREQELQSVPLAISVFDKKSIERNALLSSPGDLALYTPGFGGNDANMTLAYYTIRGIGSNAWGIGLESSVGVFVDDIYAGRITDVAHLLDVERIEVIKGPQSTMFGRNASAGVLSITSQKPQNKKEASVLLGIGNEGQKHAEYVLNHPITKNFFVRFAGRYNYRNGVRTLTNFDNNDLDKLDLFANRLSFLLRAKNGWSFQFGMEHQLADSGGLAFYNVNTDLDTTGDPFEREIEISADNIEEREQVAARIQVNKVLSDHLYLRAISGFRKSELDWFNDVDGSPVYIADFLSPASTNGFSQDIRLVGKKNRLSWLLAASLFWEEVDNDQTLIFNDQFFIGGTPIAENELEDLIGLHPAFSLCNSISDDLLGPCNPEAKEVSHSEGKYLSYSLYGNLTYALNPKLNLSAGIRFSLDDKEFSTSLSKGDGLTHWYFGGNLIAPHTGGQPIHNNKTFKGLQPRLAIDYSFNKDFMIYTSYGRGYKGGGFNNYTAISFDPENSNAYELGIKSSFAAGKFKINATVYFIDYSDLQVQIAENVTLIIDNAAEVQSKGIELEASVNFKGGVSIIGNTSIGEARYKNYQDDGGDYSGNTTDRSPDQTFSFIVQYIKPIGGTRNLIMRADYAYKSKVFFSRNNVDALSQDGYGLFNAYVEVENLWKEHLSIILFGSNLMDQNFTSYVEDPIGVGSTYGRGIPRLFGLKLRLKI